MRQRRKEVSRQQARGVSHPEYYVRLADEQVQNMSDEKTWMVTDMW